MRCTLSRRKLRFSTGVRLRSIKFSSGPVPLISAPVQNPRPEPVTITTLTLGSRLASCSEACHSSNIFGVKAFIRSGRFSVIVAMASLFSYMTCSKSIEPPSGSLPHQYAAVNVNRLARDVVSHWRRQVCHSRSDLRWLALAAKGHELLDALFNHI